MKKIKLQKYHVIGTAPKVAKVDIGNNIPNKIIEMKKFEGLLNLLLIKKGKGVVNNIKK